MKKRTTIELDQELLDRAKRALGNPTTRAVVEEALRRVAEEAEAARERRVADQRRYLAELAELGDRRVLASEEMWR